MKNKTLKLLSAGFLSIATSLSAFAAPALHSFIEIGTSFGGEEVADNDNIGNPGGGDDYYAGSGAIIGGGAILDLKDDYTYNARLFAAYRYQGGDGSNSGVVLESSLFYMISEKFSAGIGLHADLANKVETRDNDEIEFDPAAGILATIEWNATPEIGMGLKFIAIEYETDKEVSYDGNQAAVYVQFRY